jgi:TRAP-type C4-dicarboxylate transport system permease small subunit
MIRSLKNVCSVLFLLVLLVIGFERSAQAYTDPGTGALIWQMLLAIPIAVMFYFRRITFWFKKRKGSKD